MGRDRLILDGYPAPVLSRDDAVAMPYCDNVHSLSLSRTAADDSLQRMEDDLEGIGFSLHEQVSSTDFFQTLGGIVDGGTGQIRATPTRAWNILLGFEEALVSKVNWQFMQKLLGHAMTLCVLNRAGMSVFRALYDFVERAEQPRFLNKLERREVKPIPLVGVDADGLFMTLKAQPYPWAMCSQLAKCVAMALRDQGLGVRPF